MSERKLTKRTHMTCSQSNEKYETRWSTVDGVGRIYNFHQSFALMWKHRKGSNRPEGWFHSPYGDINVEVTWCWVEKLGWYAPNVSFRPHRLSTKIVATVSKALEGLRYDGTPDMLIEALQATTVTFADDNGKGDCYDDYRPLCIPGEPAMVTIARYAQ